MDMNKQQWKKKYNTLLASQVEKLKPTSDEIIVFKMNFSDYQSVFSIASIRKDLKEIFPNNKILILSNDVELDITTRQTLIEQLLERSNGSKI